MILSPHRYHSSPAATTAPPPSPRFHHLCVVSSASIWRN
ncbi:hypothetical protein SOVF_213910 [Spinacia oleracea]|nr:hypothetical protein SOVF_213910 [Spinacia oleracea]